MNTDQIIKEFKNQVSDMYGDKLKEVILYGSCARNQATDGSDIDLAVVLKGNISPGAEIDRMIDIVTEINLKYGVLLSVYPVSYKNYNTINSPLITNIRKEGLVA